MKYKHIITIHLPKGRQSFKQYEDPETMLTDDVIESLPHPDGSCILVFSTYDHLLRFRLEMEILGSTVFPPHFSSQKLTDKQAKLLNHYGVDSTHNMEEALLKITAHHKHYRFHPHSFS